MVFIPIQPKAKAGQDVVLVLPNLFLTTPFVCSTNPHYKQAGAESAAWTDSFNFFDGAARQHFMHSDFELLVAFAYPSATYDDFRTICDYMNSFFVFDNISDEQDGEAALITANTYLKALMGEDCEDSNTLFYKFVSEFGARIRAKPLHRFRRRFIQHHGSYVQAVAHEAELRTNLIQLDLAEYMALRRETVGARSSFDMMEFALNVDLPDELFENEAFRKMYYAAIDMIALGNDLHSYKKEYAAGQDWLNVLTILMNTTSMTLQEAANYIGQLSHSLMQIYLEQKHLIPSFGPESDRDIRSYMRNMDDWVVGSLEWDFRSKRYFGDDNEKVRESHVVKIGPRKT